MGDIQQIEAKKKGTEVPFFHAPAVPVPSG